MAAATSRTSRTATARARPSRAMAGAPAIAVAPTDVRSEVTLIDHALLGHRLAEQARGAEEENEHEHREGEDVAILGADAAGRHDREQTSPEGLEEAEREAAEHRSG